MERRGRGREVVVVGMKLAGVGSSRCDFSDLSGEGLQLGVQKRKENAMWLLRRNRRGEGGPNAREEHARK